MAGGYAWSRRVGARVRTLRGLVADTHRALHDVLDIITIDPEVNSFLQEIGNQSLRTTALVVLGSSRRARARLLHCLLGRELLPEDMPRGCRWIRIQYGSSTQVHLSLGNSEFELVEELEANKRAWDVLPLQDLMRRDDTELTTILEVEINNQFLKDGLRIIIPPDIATDPGNCNHIQLKKIHSELYTKRTSILNNFNCVYLYGIDKMGKNIFSDNIFTKNIKALSSSRNSEDFWSAFSLYNGSVRSSSAGNDGGDEIGDEGTISDDKVIWCAGEGAETAVFTPENCFDLRQIREINPNSQLLFLLFNDSVEMGVSPSVHVNAEATESTGDAVVCSGELPESDKLIIQARGLRQMSESPEPKPTCDDDKQRLIHEQIAFMNDLIDQWELMSSAPQKHYVRSQWAVVDAAGVARAPEQRRAGGGAGRGGARGDDKLVHTRSRLLSVVVGYGVEAVHSYLLEYCTRLSEVHIRLLQQLILASFDLARELQVVPKKIQYVAIHEQHLFETINEKFSEGEKKQELVQMMQEVIEEMKSDINSMDWSVDDLPCHQDRRFAVSNSTFYCSTQSSAYVSIPISSLPPSLYDQVPSDGEEATSYDSYNLEEYEIIGHYEETCSEWCNNTSKGEESSSCSPTDIRVENEPEPLPAHAPAPAPGPGRQLATLSTSAGSAWTLRSDVTCCSGTAVSLQHATADVQQAVLTRLSRKISLKLVNFFDCLKESYFGTLQRCLESLETSCREELGGKPASEAMRQLLSVGRQVELQPGATFSVLRTLLDTLRKLFNKMRLAGGGGGGAGEEACCALSPAWRRRLAARTLHSLRARTLARIISAQIVERLGAAHARYQAALAALQGALAARLHHSGGTKLNIRKLYAPSFARLCLESTSMCDLLMYGTPDLGREIGRGQYGVVYSVRGGWGGRAPVAVKSVLPADERHYHELAMEFFYTRSIPAHPRIVQLYGSVVQRGGGGGGGGGRCVLLVSARKVRDLHAAVRAGLAFPTRMHIAADIVEGIRYLHSLGLVHRDIKLKNVLLDAWGRAALSDLGFCTAGALLSGSVVGTPVHMAPELLQGDYCAAVDVYAFGILFWYLCAGDIKMPAAFEMFNNKEQLWSKVQKGLRPERLPHFSDECWSIMESCWHAEPDQRALLGDVQIQLQKILEQSAASDNTPYAKCTIDTDSSDHD